MGMLQMPMRVRAEDCLVFRKGSTALLVRRYRLASTANSCSFCASACWLPIPLLDKAWQCRVGGPPTIGRPLEIQIPNFGNKRTPPGGDPRKDKRLRER